MRPTVRRSERPPHRRVNTQVNSTYVFLYQDEDGPLTIRVLSAEKATAAFQRECYGADAVLIGFEDIRHYEFEVVKERGQALNTFLQQFPSIRHTDHRGIYRFGNDAEMVHFRLLAERFAAR